MVSGGGGLLASSGVWTKLEAAHVFPLECESLWNEFGFSRWVTNMDETIGKPGKENRMVSCGWEPFTGMQDITGNFLELLAQTITMCAEDSATNY